VLSIKDKQDCRIFGRTARFSAVNSADKGIKIILRGGVQYFAQLKRFKDKYK
jgi:hypothetical protein